VRPHTALAALALVAACADDEAPARAPGVASGADAGVTADAGAGCGPLGPASVSLRLSSPAPPVGQLEYRGAATVEAWFPAARLRTARGEVLEFLATTREVDWPALTLSGTVTVDVGYRPGPVGLDSVWVVVDDGTRALAVWTMHGDAPTVRARGVEYLRRGCGVPYGPTCVIEPLTARVEGLGEVPAGGVLTSTSSGELFVNGNSRATQDRGPCGDEPPEWTHGVWFVGP